MAEIKKVKSRIYSDINLLMGIHPTTRDVIKRVDEDAVKNSIKNLVMTNLYERLFHPEIGCQITAMLFEPYTPVTSQIMRTTIENVIKKYEPRAILQNVSVNGDADNNAVAVTIEFFIINIDRPEPFTLTTFLTRVR